LLLAGKPLKPAVLIGVAKVRSFSESASKSGKYLSFFFLHFAALQFLLNIHGVAVGSMRCKLSEKAVYFSKRLPAPAGLISRSFGLGVQKYGLLPALQIRTQKFLYYLVAMQLNN
jgi:hypothetical protein